jgi:hypothetical protein
VAVGRDGYEPPAEYQKGIYHEKHLGAVVMICFLRDMLKLAAHHFENQNAVRDHHLTPEEEEAFQSWQCCVVCKTTFSSGTGKFRDHCHGTGRFRGPLSWGATPR